MLTFVSTVRARDKDEHVVEGEHMSERERGGEGEQRG